MFEWDCLTDKAMAETYPVRNYQFPIISPENEDEKEPLRVFIDGIEGFCHIIRIEGMDDQISITLDSEHPELGLGTITSDFRWDGEGPGGSMFSSLYWIEKELVSITSEKDTHGLDWWPPVTSVVDYREARILRCGKCGDEVDDEDTVCSDCGKVYFCYDCQLEEGKYGPLLMCEECSEEHHQAMEKYPTDSEKSQIGHRQGGLDPYKNDEEHD